MNRLTLSASAAALLVASASLGAQQPLPLKHAPKPTSAAISEADLMTRLYLFADDSMQGRQFGREGNRKGTDYIAAELKRLGLEPAGDNGTYFQALPVMVRAFTAKSTLAANGRALKWNDDFVAVPSRLPRLFTRTQAIFGGVAFDTVSSISREQAAGKLVVLLPAPPGQGGFGGGGGGGGGGAGFAARNPITRYADAAAIVTIDLDNLTTSQRIYINDPQGNTQAAPPAPTPVTLRITTAAAAMIFGRPVAELAPGTSGATLDAALDFVETPRPEWGRNVVAIARGSDPALRGQFVALGAHNDHVGYNATPSDHDSTSVARRKSLLMSFVGKDTIRRLTPEEQRSITVNVDSLRRIRPPRLDSIRNGADDDGSGSMALLEIAEAIARMPTKPRRSILFVWHTGEEAGLQGARFYMANPTVPRDSIITQLNMDMIGRGAADDIPGGSPDFLGVVGSGFISKDLGEAVRSVNARQARPLALDYRFDSDVTGSLGASYNNIYGRSDHAEYARRGIPIAFFFTGLHADYHQVTDEPQYIDYQHYNRITNFIRDLAMEMANRDKRPSIDKPTP